MSFTLSFLPGICLAAQAYRHIRVENPGPMDLIDAPIAIKISDFNLEFQPKSAIVSWDNNEIPSQLDDINRDNKLDELAFVINLQGNEVKILEIVFSDIQEQKPYTPRTFAQIYVRGYENEIVPIEDISVKGNVDSYTLLYGHGAMFESEINGYRVYFDPKQTIDPYGKFQKRLELEQSKFYPNDLQLEKGFGDDILIVAQSCGVGALKGWNGMSPTNIEPLSRRSQHLIASGPVRAIVQIKDQGWQYSPQRVLNMSQTFTQWAGHRDVDIDVSFDEPLGDEEFVIGVMNILGDETKHSYGENTISSWGKYWPVGDTVKYAKERVGISSWIPKEIQKCKVEDSNGFYYVVNAPKYSGFNYSTMFISAKEIDSGINSFPEWIAYTEEWRRIKENPIKVKVLDIP